MIEIERILNQFKEINDNIFCLAEVVKVYGSSYRRPGAKMLISNSGSFWGTVSGGCLEGDALKQAKLSMKENISIIKTYDTSDDNNNTISRNLGCNGIIDILFQPINKDSEILKEIKNSFYTDNYLLIATKINEPYLGKRYFFNSNNQFDISNTFIYENFKKLINEKINFLAENNENGVLSEYFFEYIPPRMELVIFGSGFDIKPIIILAKSLAWKVIVTSDSYSITIPEDFYPADVIEYIDRDELKENIKISDNSYCLLISHNYKYDKKALSSLMHSPSKYIGILGPKKRFEMMKSELLSENEFNENDFEKVFSPVGLNIGADNPDEIALSVISEILAFSRNRFGNSLKFKDGNIH